MWKVWKFLNNIWKCLKNQTEKTTVLSMKWRHKYTAQKDKFSIKNFFSKLDHIRWKLLIWSHLLKKFLMGNWIFCAVIFGKTKPITYQCTSLFPCFGELISSYSASILHPYSLAYSETSCHRGGSRITATSKMDVN